MIATIIHFKSTKQSEIFYYFLFFLKLYFHFTSPTEFYPDVMYFYA